MKTEIWKSRRFWTLTLDVVVSLVFYFVGKYGGMAADDVKFLVTTMQPMFAVLIAAYTVDDINATSLAKAQLTLAAKK